MRSPRSRARESWASIASGAIPGYAIGGLIAGVTADALGYGGAITIVAALTAGSGLWVLYDMPTKQRPSTSTVHNRGRARSVETATAHGEPAA